MSWSPILVTGLLAFSALALHADPRLILSKRFPHSRPEFAELRIERDGRVEYRETADEEPMRVKLTRAETDTVFDLAEKCDRFKKPLESGLNVARMGEKLFRWESGDEKHEVKFNYTLDATGQALLDWYEKIVESEIYLIDLERTARYDVLGVNESLLQLESGYDRKRLVSVEQYLPMLDRIAKNEKYMNMARERAAKLAETFRAISSGAAATPKAGQ
ncbi:MAG: hypothetical protein P4K98_08930 [Bryobacteraceae bacterium]|nr:hypothetical protein [Bryobacteraceae bacterium]